MTDISKFLLLDRLAVGGMAEVYRAKSLGVHGFEKIIAIKRMLPQLAEDDEFVQMFVEEAKIAGRLRHANITRIFELGKVQGTHFIAMEYVFGKDLLQIRKRLEATGRRMSPAMAAWIIAAVLAGLDYAHRQRGADGQPLGIIHRDISPQNVLISYDGLIKLCDFGIAKAASRATQTVAGVIKGKLGYMSPEQITGRPIDHRSDVFAASTVLWELLTGERLFGVGSDFEVLQRVRDAKADPPSTRAPEVSQLLDAVVLRGLARDADDRWESAGDMHEALMG
ncbi:MAG: serine/threonine protein kinase, partial [Myxococcales bacterium]|nr:serine/threonine protein kinase [Myxococcales bacterium]